MSKQNDGGAVMSEQNECLIKVRDILALSEWGEVESTEEQA
jgi:hypothetical protein